MSNINKKLFNRLHLNHAYGQLIALIFVPIMILACVGALLVITETSNAAKAQQRQMAIAILTRYQLDAEAAINLEGDMMELLWSLTREEGSGFNEMFHRLAA